MRRTKILVTAGPASASPAGLRALVEAGADAVRVNFSHGDDAQHRQVLGTVRSLSDALGRKITTVADLQGPKIRLGTLEPDARLLNIGDEVNLEEGVGPSRAPDLPVALEGLLDAAPVGQRILLGDGAVELEVLSTGTHTAKARVVSGGTVSSHQGIYFPGAKIAAAALSPKDEADLRVAVEAGADWIALSFVDRAEDLERARTLLRELSPERKVYVMAKVERAAALEHQRDIVHAADAIMVARGDLGIEVPLARLALAQKSLIAEALAAAKPVVVATQMLLSMVHSPRPTRAEATDVANAVLDGADCMMLSEETAVGEYPNEAVRYLARIAETTEPALWPTPSTTMGKDVEPSGHEPLSVEAAVAESVVHLAGRIGAKAIVVPSHSGRSARLVARYRPRMPVLVLSSQPATSAAVGFLWGVRSRAVPGRLPLEELREAARVAALEELQLERGDRIVLTAGYPVEGRPTNLLTVVEI